MTEPCGKILGDRHPVLNRRAGAETGGRVRPRTPEGSASGPKGSERGASSEKGHRKPTEQSLLTEGVREKGACAQVPALCLCILYLHPCHFLHAEQVTIGLRRNSNGRCKVTGISCVRCHGWAGSPREFMTPDVPQLRELRLHRASAPGCSAS